MDATSEHVNMRAEAESATRQIDAAFRRYTGGIETTENDEVSKMREVLTSEARRFMASWKQGGWVDGSTEAQVLTRWQNAIALDEKQSHQFGDFQAAMYQQVIEELSKTDPSSENKDVQALISQAREIAGELQRGAQESLAYIYRPHPLQRPEAEAVGMPGQSVVLNLGKRNTLAGREGQLKAVACEETTHMLSQLESYGIQTKWVEEMMARVVPFVRSTGYSREDPYYGVIKNGLRAVDYQELYRRSSYLIGDRRALLRMFFGKEPHDSPVVEKVKTALKQINIIGEMVDAGMPLKELIESQRPIESSSQIKATSI
jgi:hypothetical protein